MVGRTDSIAVAAMAGVRASRLVAMRVRGKDDDLDVQKVETKDRQKERTTGPLMVDELVDLMVSRGVDVMVVCWAVWTVSESAALRVDTSEYEGAVAKAVELVA